MNARIRLCAAAVAGSSWVMGCASHPAAPNAKVITAPAASPAQPKSVTVTDLRPRPQPDSPPAPDGGLAAALAQKAADFSKALNDTSTPPTDPNAVQWSQPTRPAPAARKPRQFALTPPTADANTPASVLPVSPPSPPALVSAKLHPDSDEGPTIVPESLDFPKSTSSSPDDLGTSLQRRLRNNPHDLSAQLDNQLYELLRDDTESKWTSTSELSTDDRELVAAVVDGLSNLRNGIRQDSNAPMSKRVQPLTDMAERARAQAGLAIANMTLCRHISGFGSYEPIDPARFPAGRANSMLVYCELQNFQSRLNDKRLWETQLTQQVTVFTDTGILIWKGKEQPVPDFCRNRRNDFCMHQLITLPANMSIGRYLVKMTVVDKLANRVDESAVPVEIGTQ